MSHQLRTHTYIQHIYTHIQKPTWAIFELLAWMLQDYLSSIAHTYIHTYLHIYTHIQKPTWAIFELLAWMMQDYFSSTVHTSKQACIRTKTNLSDLCTACLNAAGLSLINSAASLFRGSEGLGSCDVQRHAVTTLMIPYAYIWWMHVQNKKNKPLMIQHIYPYTYAYRVLSWMGAHTKNKKNKPLMTSIYDTRTHTHMHTWDGCMGWSYQKQEEQAIDDCTNVQNRLPIIAQNVEADFALHVDIRVENLCMCVCICMCVCVYVSLYGDIKADFSLHVQIRVENLWVHKHVYINIYAHTHTHTRMQKVQADSAYHQTCWHVVFHDQNRGKLLWTEVCLDVHV